MCVSFALHYLSGAGKAIIPVKKNLIAMVFPREPNDDDNNNNNKHFCSAVQS